MFLKKKGEKMKKNYAGGVLAVALLLSGVRVLADLSFVDEKFGDFLVRFVPDADRDGFSSYYQKFSNLLAGGKEVEVTAEKTFKRAMAYLQKDHTDWFKEIAEKAKTARAGGTKAVKQLQGIQIFLARYSAYKDFLVVRSRTKTPDLPGFIDQKFDDFIARFVFRDHREKFANYYARLTRELAMSDDGRKKETFRYLNSRALENLSNNHAEWYSELASYLAGVKAAGGEQNSAKFEVARRFLRRYGAYCEYQKIEVGHVRGDLPQEEQSSGLFAQIGSFFSGIGQTFVGWFGFGERTTA